MAFRGISTVPDRCVRSIGQLGAQHAVQRILTLSQPLMQDEVQHVDERPLISVPRRPKLVQQPLQAVDRFRVGAAIGVFSAPFRRAAAAFFRAAIGTARCELRLWSALR